MSASSGTNGSTGLFVKVPHRLATDTRVSHPALRLWTILQVFAWHGEIPETERLQVLLNSTERSIQRWARELEDNGWLTWDRKAAPGRRYQVKSDGQPSREGAVLSLLREMIDSPSVSLAEIRALIENAEATPRSDTTIRSYDQILLSPDLTPESPDATVGSDLPVRSSDQILLSQDATDGSDPATPESPDATPESDRGSFSGFTEPKNDAPRLLDSERRETPLLLGQSSSSSELDSRVRYLVEQGVYPTKARAILDSWPTFTMEELQAQVSELRRAGAGAGAVAEMLQATGPTSTRSPAPAERPPSVRVIHTWPGLTPEQMDRWIRRFHQAETQADKRAVLARLAKEHPQ